jgi:hypothetical protein
VKGSLAAILFDCKFRQSPAFAPNELPLKHVNCPQQTFVVLGNVLDFLAQNGDSFVGFGQLLLEIELCSDASMNFVLQKNYLLLEDSDELLLLKDELFLDLRGVFRLALLTHRINNLHSNSNSKML